jgi:hypothetical protein
MKTEKKTIYHVHAKKTGNDFYYTSVAAIFENHNALGTTFHSVRVYFTKHTRFENGRCYIRKGALIRKLKDGRKKNMQTPPHLL